MKRLLALVAERGQLFNPSALVFASRSGSGVERKVAREALKRAVKAAGIAPPEPTLHDLRHSHASMLIALDVSVVDVQRRLGHRKPDTTLRVYAHQWKYREARRSEIGQQLGRLFDNRKALPAPGARATRLALPPASGDQRREEAQ
jgi:integrase